MVRSFPTHSTQSVDGDGLRLFGQSCRAVQVAERQVGCPLGYCSTRSHVPSLMTGRRGRTCRCSAGRQRRGEHIRVLVAKEAATSAATVKNFIAAAAARASLMSGRWRVSPNPRW